MGSSTSDGHDPELIPECGMPAATSQHPGESHSADVAALRIEAKLAAKKTHCQETFFYKLLADRSAFRHTGCVRATTHQAPDNARGRAFPSPRAFCFWALRSGAFREMSREHCLLDSGMLVIALRAIVRRSFRFRRRIVLAHHDSVVAPTSAESLASSHDVGTDDHRVSPVK